MIWWASSMCSVRLKTKTNESGMNKAGSLAIHTVPERHKIWHQTWNTHRTSPSLVSLSLSYTHTHSPTHESYNYIQICAHPLLLVAQCAISHKKRPTLCYQNNNSSWMIGYYSKWLYFCQGFGGQGNRNRGGGDDKTDALPSSPHLKLNDAVGCDLPHYRLITSLWERRLTVFRLEQSRAGCGRTDQCQLCQAASQVTRAPSD